MLCDELIVNLAEASGCDIKPVLPRLQRAQKFVLGPEFAAVAEELANDYSGLTRIFPHCRLPYKDVWLEVAQADRPAFMAAEMHIPQLQLKPKRIGFLLTATRDDLSAWKAHLFWSFDGKEPSMSCSAALCATAYDMTHPLHDLTDLSAETLEETVKDQQIGPITVHGFRAHEGWLQAKNDIRLMMVNHTDLVAADFRYILPGVEFMNQRELGEFVRVTRILSRADWAGEATYLLAVIGLLNARNAVETETVDLSRLNRVRVRNDKRQLFEHKILKIARRVHKKVYPDGKGAGDHAPMREHFVRSHWKHRKTGIFFWRPFVRGDAKHGHIEKDYELK